MSDTPIQAKWTDFPFEDSGFFVLRTPLLPADSFASWSAGMEASLAAEQGPGELLEQAIASDVRLLREKLREIIERPEIIQALFLASPSLLSGVEYWKAEPDSKKGIQAQRSLIRYFTRMCLRPTPFGLFSGGSVGRISVTVGTPTVLELQQKNCFRTSSRLGFDYLLALTEQLEKKPEIAEHLQYTPNSSLHKKAGKAHYVESRFSEAGVVSHHLVSVETDSHLNAVLERAAGGASIAELVATIVAGAPHGDISAAEARDYVQELIDNGVLVSDLAPLLTGPPALDDLVGKLKSFSSGMEAAQTLEDVRTGLAGFDRRRLGVQPEEYRNLASELECLPAKVDLGHLFQVDMVKPVADATLSRFVRDEVLRGLEVLCRLPPSDPPGLNAFRDAFLGRYDRARVPLLEALDHEIGLGFGQSESKSPLLNRLFGSGPPSEGPAQDFETLLMRTLLLRSSQNQMEVELDLAGVPLNPRTIRSLPNAFSVDVTLIASSSEAIESGNFQVWLRGGQGPSGGRMYGRFCHADPDLENYLRGHLRDEAACDPGAIHAEIVHFPEGRIGNVLSRPILRDYEIVYLGRSGAPAEAQISVADLLVSVERDQIVLHSRRLNRRVIPRMTNAHSFYMDNQASVYRFLALLQHQNGAVIPSFSWGKLSESEFLPRVRAGRYIVSLAQWRISADEIQKLAKTGTAKRFLAIQELRRRRGLPRWVALVDYDNVLPMDLDNILCVDACLHAAARNPESTVLREMYPGLDQLCVRSPEGRFVHELSVPFVRRREAKAEAPTVAVKTLSRHRAASELRRDFPPGSEWAYYKVYAGPAVLDRVLREVVPGLVERIRKTGAISRWFFIRYGDPDKHIRMRFQGSPERMLREVCPLLTEAFSPLLAAGALWKSQLDTYTREVERYGGDEGVIAAEEIFTHDSDAVLDILKLIADDVDSAHRWQIALLGADMLLTDLGFDLPTKHSMAQAWRESFKKEFRVGIAGERLLGSRFRALRPGLASLLDGESDNRLLQAARVIFERRSAGLRPASARLRALENSGRLNAGLPPLANSYVHMHVNRFMPFSARQYELVIYDFLTRLYESRIARRPTAVKAVEESLPEASEMNAGR
jgi:thiopeptide-type bacteriocin biosynthesis protein